MGLALMLLLHQLLLTLTLFSLFCCMADYQSGAHSHFGLAQLSQQCTQRPMLLLSNSSVGTALGHGYLLRSMLKIRECDCTSLIG